MQRSFRISILTALAVASIVGCSKEKETQYVDRPVPLATPIPDPQEQVVRTKVVQSDRFILRGLFVQERGNARNRRDYSYRVRLFADKPEQGANQRQSARSQTIARGTTDIETNRIWTPKGWVSYSKWSFEMEVQGWQYLQAARKIGLSGQDPGYVQISFEDGSGQVVDSSTFVLSDVIRSHLTLLEGRTEDGRVFRTQAEMSRFSRVHTFKQMIADYNDADLSSFAFTAITENDMIRYPISMMWASPRGGASGFTYCGADVELIPGRHQ